MSAQEDVATQCLNLSVQGLPLRAIGAELGISATTVQRHLRTFSVGQVLAAQRRALGAAHLQALDNLNRAIARMNEQDMSAPCSVDPQLWDGKTKQDRDLAKWECGRCPAQVECRRVGKFERTGIWGGWLAGRAKATQAVLEGFD